MDNSYNSGNPDSINISDRVWGFSGFDQGHRVYHEFSGPSSSTDTFPYRESCIIGRDPARCHFVIKDGAVSSVHAELKFFPDQGIGIRDLNSTNGTLVNGNPIGSEEYSMLKIGSTVTMGSIEITVSYPR